MSRPSDPDHGRAHPRSRADRDTLAAAALRLLLVEHPAQLTLAELVLKLTVGSDDDPGAVEDAVRMLVGAGLARRNGELVIPSRAALCFDRLPID